MQTLDYSYQDYEIFILRINLIYLWHVIFDMSLLQLAVRSGELDMVRALLDIGVPHGVELGACFVPRTLEPSRATEMLELLESRDLSVA